MSSLSTHEALCRLCYMAQLSLENFFLNLELIVASSYKKFSSALILSTQQTPSYLASALTNMTNQTLARCSLPQNIKTYINTEEPL